MTKLEQAAEILRDAREEIAELLDGEGQSVSNFVSNSLVKIENRLSRINGSSPNAPDRPTFEPVTRFMGESIKSRKPLTADDLNPTKSERDLLSDKVDQLFGIIQTMDPAEVVENYANTPNEIVVRGVAKRAGVPDYGTDKVTVSFVEDIIEAIRAADAKTQEELDIEERLKQQNALFNNGADGTENDPEDDTEDDADGEEDSEGNNEDSPGEEQNPAADAKTQEEVDAELKAINDSFDTIKNEKQAATADQAKKKKESKPKK